MVDCEQDANWVTGQRKQKVFRASQEPSGKEQVTWDAIQIFFTLLLAYYTRLFFFTLAESLITAEEANPES